MFDGREGKEGRERDMGTGEGKGGRGRHTYVVRVCGERRASCAADFRPDGVIVVVDCGRKWVSILEKILDSIELWDLGNLGREGRGSEMESRGWRRGFLTFHPIAAALGVCVGAHIAPTETFLQGGVGFGRGGSGGDEGGEKGKGGEDEAVDVHLGGGGWGWLRRW